MRITLCWCECSQKWIQGNQREADIGAKESQLYPDEAYESGMVHECRVRTQ